MAGLIKRGDTYYIVLSKRGKQTRRSLRTKSYQIAQHRKREIELDLARGVTDPTPTRTPVGEVIARFIEHMKAHRPERSWKRDLSYLRELFGECCEALVITEGRARKCRDLRRPDDRRRKYRTLDGYFEQITTAQVADTIEDRVRGRGLAPKTANRYREVATKVFNWAIDTGTVRMPMDKNPASKVKRYREDAPEIRYLTLAQVDEQLLALRHLPWLQVMVATLIYAGLRREELLWLQVGDVIAPTPTAPNGLLRVHAKTVQGTSWQPKTKTNRAVPIGAELREYLSSWAPPPSDCDWLFPSPRGTRWDTDNFSQTIAKVNRASGLPWTCLDFRHTFGSILAQRGVSLLKLAILLGNSPEICRRHYATIPDEHLAGDVTFHNQYLEHDTHHAQS
ncbi:MAG: tyrosine-type recombinase/integrase [Phycisphaerales bacterium]